MAHNDIEVEIKIEIDKQSFDKIKKKVAEIAKFDKNNSQIDEYYSPKHRDFLAPDFPFEWLSTRQRGGKFILNYKHFHPENVPVFSHCDEFETIIEKPEQFKKIMKALDFSTLVTVEKERETYNYEDEFEIAFDAVKDLGYFIEIENLKDLGDVNTAKDRIMDFAKKLGIKDMKIVNKGYPYLLMEKKNMLKK